MVVLQVCTQMECSLNGMHNLMYLNVDQSSLFSHLEWITICSSIDYTYKISLNIDYRYKMQKDMYQYLLFFDIC